MFNGVFGVNDFLYENQGANTFLVYSVGEEGVDAVSLGMLTNNKIPGMARVLFMQMDKSKIIKYNVSSKITLKQYFSGVVNKAKLLGVFSGIVDTVLAAEDYMIDIKTIVMDSDYIFLDARTSELSLVCVPLSNSSVVYKNPVDLFKEIMFSTNFDQTENCDYVAKIINYVNSTQVFSYANFKMLIDSLHSFVQPFSASQFPQSHVQERRDVVQPVISTSVKSQPVVVESTVVNNTPVQPKITPPVEAPQEKVEEIPQNQEQGGEKEITMLQLLMHYSKENAEKYKAQKASKQPSTEKKSSNAGSLFSIPGKATAAKAESKPRSQVVKSSGFEIPGQKSTASQMSSAPVTTNKGPATVQQEKQSAIDSMPIYQTQAAPKEQNMNFGETMVLGGGGYGETTLLNETTVLGQVPQQPKWNAFIIRVRNSEKVIINKPVFRIGKERSYVDYFIGDNTAISRSHANIINRDDNFYIVDTNSTNHTYVDGLMLQNNVETKLTNGCKIRLANEDFEFKIL